VFGFTIGMIGCYKGFHATQGTRGVGKAANQAVVLAMFLNNEGTLTHELTTDTWVFK
jgi:hypothetical protein